MHHQCCLLLRNSVGFQESILDSFVIAILTFGILDKLRFYYISQYIPKHVFIRLHLKKIRSLGEGMELVNPAISCMKIKTDYQSAKSGHYWVHLKTDSVRVFCDMETDGGK